jgi:hypothetical protein
MAMTPRIDPDVLTENTLSVPDVDGNYLGLQSVVEGLVRGYIVALVNDRIAHAKGDMTTAVFTDMLASRTDAIAKIFMGEDPLHPPIPSWNSATVLGEVLLAKGWGDTNEDAVAAMFADAAHRISEAMDAHAADGDEEQGQFAVDSVVEDMVALLLGLPTDAEERSPPPDALPNL